MRSDRPLERRSVVVTRADHQSRGLLDRLEALGATPVAVPLIAVADPVDPRAVDRELDRIDTFDWVVVTSPNGARRLAAAGGATTAARVAVVGPGTAEALAAVGRRADLVPTRAVAEGLLEAFDARAATGETTGRVLLFQAEAARPVLADGLRAAGWDVTVVAAYRTVPATVDGGQRARIAAADAITFTSSSTVSNFLAADGMTICPPVVVCIGPVTAGTARAGGLTVDVVAEPHTLDGLVDAVVSALT